MTEVPKKKITREGLRNAFKLYGYIRPFGGEYLFGMFFLLGSSLSYLAFPKLMGDLVNSGNNGMLGQTLNQTAILLGVLLLLQSVFSYFRVVLFVNVTEKSLALLRRATCNHLIKLPLRFFEQRRVGELNSRISADVTLLQETLTTTLAEFIRQIIIIIGGTIKENIAYGKPSASEEEILDAAQKANAMEFVNRFPDKLDTLVGERGTQLSGGQRQRIAIARAVLKNPRVLILDEATSSLDSESEKWVQDALEKLMVGRTSIVIAHRLSTIRKADNIVVVDQGKIAEQGTHKQLMQLPEGIYKNLSELQFAI